MRIGVTVTCIGVAALLLSDGCARKLPQPVIVTAPNGDGTPWQSIFTVPKTVPGFALFCVEDPGWNWESPSEFQRQDGLKCVMTVNELRAMIARTRLAER